MPDQIHSTLVEAKNAKGPVTIYKLDNSIISGVPTYAECDNKGNRWTIDMDRGSTQVYEHEIARVLRV